MSNSVSSKSTDPETDAGTTEIETSTPHLRVRNISKSYRHIEALKDVSLDVAKNEVVGLVGENGAGKSTLLNILTGVISPDSGTIEIDGEDIAIDGPKNASEHGISLVQQEQDVIPNLTGYENLYLGRFDQFSRFGKLNRERMRTTAQEFIDDLNLSLDMGKAVREYSFDQRQMLEIARAFDIALESGFYPTLLLDEPTAALEEEGRDILFNRINDLKDEASFVFVSHELDEVIEICDRIYVLKDGEVVDELPESEASPDLLQERMVGRAASDEFYRTSRQPPASEIGDTGLSIENLELEDAVGPVSFSVGKGEIFGIAGVDGSGKEELGRLLAGNLSPSSGTISVNGTPIQNHSERDHIRAGIGYIPKERKSEGLLLYQTIRSNVSLPTVREMNGSMPIMDREQDKALAEEAVEKLNIKTPGIDELARNLSGGNQQKVVLGRWLVRDTSILVMDNPTRGLDVGAKEEVYDLCRQMAEEGKSIVYLGDELPEVIGLSNRIGIVKHGQLKTIIDAPPEDKPTEEDIIQEMV